MRESTWRVRCAALALTGLVAALGACEGDDGEEPAECAQGETRGCTCDDGASGTQACGAYGTWATCACESAPDVVDDTANDAVEDAAPDVVILPDGAECLPDCDGKVCGFDGCGGTCGSCGDQANCVDGQCAICEGTTCCAYPFGEVQDARPLGAACEHDLECAYGECLLPGEGGNDANEVFGFCTRGCNCGFEVSELTDEEDDDYFCALPGGNQGGWRHVVMKCSTVEDCTAVDPRWTGCSQSVFSPARVCTAFADDEEL